MSIELDDHVRAIALAAGGVTGHAAIVARGLGLPMVVGVGAELLAIDEGAPCIVDADQSIVVVSPDAARLETVRTLVEAATAARQRAMSERELPTVTRDSRLVRVLANAATPAEVRAALAAGADGVGLLRTELAFLEAKHWPTVAEHLRTLRPLLSRLRGLTATVRLLDFGADKTPPFLKRSVWTGRGTPARRSPGALRTARGNPRRRRGDGASDPHPDGHRARAGSCRSGRSCTHRWGPEPQATTARSDGRGACCGCHGRSHRPGGRDVQRRHQRFDQLPARHRSDAPRPVPGASPGGAPFDRRHGPRRSKGRHSRRGVR